MYLWTSLFFTVMLFSFYIIAHMLYYSLRGSSLGFLFVISCGWVVSEYDTRSCASGVKLLSPMASVVFCFYGYVCFLYCIFCIHVDTVFTICIVVWLWVVFLPSHQAREFLSIFFGVLSPFLGMNHFLIFLPYTIYLLLFRVILVLL